MKLEDTQTDMYKQAKTELLPGEDLLWVGRPKPRHMVMGRSTAGNKSAIMAVLVGLQVLGMGAFMFMSRAETSTSGSSSTSMILPILIFTFILGIAMALPLWRMNQGKNTVYAITDRRVLLISSNSVQSFGEQDIQFVRRKMHRDGTGNITFRTDAASGIYGGGISARTRNIDVGFFGISDPHEVEALMLDTFRPETHTGKRKHDDELWDDEDQYFEEETGKSAANNPRT
jgi:hypothetical protein